MGSHFYAPIISICLPTITHTYQRPCSLKPSIGYDAQGAGVEGLALAGLPLEELAAVREIDIDCCWFFIGDLGRRASISGVVTTRWGASGGGFLPPPPCQTLPSLSAKFLMYAWKLTNLGLAYQRGTRMTSMTKFKLVNKCHETQNCYSIKQI